MLAPPKKRAGIIGCGQIGSLFDEHLQNPDFIKTHAAAYFYNNKFELVALHDINQERACQAQHKWLGSKAYAKIEDLLEQNLDIISLCTPPSKNLELIRKISEYKIPLLFCEKPLGMNLTELLEIQALLRGSSTKVMVNYIRRYDTELRSFKKQIQENQFGPLQKIICNYGKGLRNNASHAINLLQFLISSPTSAKFVKFCNDDRLNTDDPTCDFILDFALQNSASAYFIAQNHYCYTLFELDFFFELGRVTLKDGARKIEYYSTHEDPDFKGYTSLKIDRVFDQGLKSTFKTALLEAENILESKGQASCSSLEDVILTENIIRAIKESQLNGGANTNVSK